MALGSLFEIDTTDSIFVIIMIRFIRLLILF